MTALLLFLAAPGVVVADDEATPSDQPAPGELVEDEFSALRLFDRARELRPRISLQNQAVVQLPHDGAKVDAFSERFRASIAAPVSKAVVLRLTGQIEATLFDFHGDHHFLDTGRRSGDPFDELLSNDFSLEGRYAVTDDWSLLGGLSYDSSWERGSRYQDSIDLNGLLGVGYIFRETVSVIAGVRAGSRIGGSPSFSPVARIGWRITEDFEIETENIGVRLTARATNQLALYLSARRSSQSWDLENRGGTIGKARLRDRRVPVVLGARWKPSKHWVVRGFVGALAYQKYTVTNEDGDTIDRERSNGPAFTFQTRIEYRF